MNSRSWDKVFLSDIMDIIGGGTPKTTIEEYWNGDINWISVKDFNGDSKYITDTEKTITELGLNKSSTKLLQKNDIIISARGTVGALGMISKPMAFNQSCYGLRAKSHINSDFLFYLLKNSIRILQNNTHGSVFNTITRNTFDTIEVKVPDINEQKAIADILSSLDDKIELNNQMNETLEEMAQALFKRWFVDFEFPNEEGKPYKSSGGEMIESELGMIPKGWNVKSLDQIASFLNGLAMQKFRPNEDEDSLPVLKIKELRQEKVTSDSDRCTVNIDSKYKVNDGDVIFSWSGTLDARIWCGGEVGLNQHLFKVTSDLYPKWFYYMWVVEYLHQFIRIAADRATTMGHIKRQHLTEAQVLVAPKDQLDKMGKVLTPIIEKIIQNKVEKRSLESLRDTLLPKLMSGEIRVSELC